MLQSNDIPDNNVNDSYQEEHPHQSLTSVFYNFEALQRNHQCLWVLQPVKEMTIVVTFYSTAATYFTTVGKTCQKFS